MIKGTTNTFKAEFQNQECITLSFRYNVSKISTRLNIESFCNMYLALIFSKQLLVFIFHMLKHRIVL